MNVVYEFVMYNILYTTNNISISLAFRISIECTFHLLFLCMYKYIIYRVFRTLWFTVVVVIDVCACIFVFVTIIISDLEWPPISHFLHLHRPRRNRPHGQIQQRHRRH